uniref:Potassium voltage-gated channel interacting protein 2 n=1 Tax=Felis catus TaxID=9685 RepID=A0ABI7X7Y9_FELCA
MAVRTPPIPTPHPHPRPALPSLETLRTGASDGGDRGSSPPAARRKQEAEEDSVVRDSGSGPAGPALPRRPRRAHSGGGGDLTAPGLGGGAWPVHSQPNHEPMPPQVPEPVGASSTIPLPASDWVAVARNVPAELSTRRTSSRFTLSSFLKETPAHMPLSSSMPLTPTMMALSVSRTSWLVCR